MTKRILRMSGMQASAVVALESLLSDMRLSLVCPRCLAAQEPSPFVGGANAPGDRRWTLTCACTTRVIKPWTVRTMPVSSDLLIGSQDLWRGLDLEVRCPRRAPECLSQPLTIRLSATERIIRCGCATHRITGAVPVGAA